MTDWPGRAPGRIAGSEAHLPAHRRAYVLVRRFPAFRRPGLKLLGVALLILLNEMRGFAVAASVWRSLFH